MPRTRLMVMRGEKIIYPIDDKKETSNILNNLSSIDSTNAKTKLDAGPAREISAASFRGFLRL